MLILALDTTTRAGSVAVVRDGAVVYEAAGDPSVSHAQRLPGDLMQALAAAAVRLEEVRLFAIGAGPGSFTGLRVGIATVQGLAMALGRQIVPVPVLEALARAGAGDAPVGAWMDAQRGQVFGALYERDGRTPLASATALAPAATLELWRAVCEPRRVRFIGDGALRYHGDLERELGADVTVLPPPLLAGVIGRIADEAPDRAVAPHAVVPVYVRRPDVELVREARLGHLPGTPP